MQPNAAFCNRCGNQIVNGLPANRPISLLDKIKHFIVVDPNRAYLIVGVICAASVLLVGTGVYFSSTTYSFSDTNSSVCTTQSGSGTSCTTTDEPTTNSISDIGEITANEPDLYRQELIKKLQDKSVANIKTCSDKKAAEAMQLFGSKTQAYYVDLCAMDPGYLSSSLSVLEKLYQQFPFAVAGVNAFSVEKLEPGTYGNFGPRELKTGNSVSTMYAGLVLTTRMFSSENIDKAKKSYKQDLQSKFHPKNTAYDYVFAHEVAHDMEYLLILKQAGVNDLLAMTDPNDLYEVVELWKKYAVSGKIVTEAITNAQNKQASQGKPKKSEATMIKDIAGYAAQKDDSGKTMYPETLAEAVTDYLANGDGSSELTLEIIPILKRELAKI